MAMFGFGLQMSARNTGQAKGRGMLGPQSIAGLGHEPPKRPEWLIASVDGRPIPPYWNSGVIITTDRSLPTRWQSTPKFCITRTNCLSQPMSSLSTKFRSQSQCEKTRLGPFVSGKTTLSEVAEVVPSDVAVLHYGDRHNLARVLPFQLRTELKRGDAILHSEFPIFSLAFLVLFSTKSGIILPYKQKERARQIVKHYLPSAMTQ